MAPEWRVRARLRKVSASLLLGGLSLLAPLAHAAAPSIWYRASDGCPDGPSFLVQLESRGVEGRLADVGDHVDFVVTLGQNGDHSSGRLERQTSEGTIAIREVEGTGCEAVADAIALSLALAHDPEAPGAAPVRPEGEASSTAAPAASPAASAEVAPPAASESAVEPPEPAPPASPLAEQRVTFAVGLAALASDAFEGPWVFSAGPFVEIQAPASFVLPHATLRAAIHGGLRPDGGVPVQMWLAAGRLEGCPVGLVWGRFTLRPCAAFDAGVLGASAAGVSDTGGWFAALAHARAELALGKISVEAQLGAVVPLSRYEVVSSATTLEKTRDVGFSTGIGVRYRFE